MKSATAFVCFLCWMSTVAGFTAVRQTPRIPITPMALAHADVPPMVILPSQSSQIESVSPLSQGILQHMSSTTVALQERKIPTAEEVQQKKNTFNLIFWGGGFVAPFLATIFYFGFRFWEK